VDHRGAHVVVTQQLLYRADIASIFEQMGGEGVAEGMRRGPLSEACPTDGLGHGALYHGLVQVMTAALARGAVEVEAGGRKDPLPRPLPAGVRILAGQGPGQLDPAGTACQVGLVLPLYSLQVLGEGPLGHCWPDSDAILGALAVADDDLTRCEVDVLDSQAGALEQA